VTSTSYPKTLQMRPPIGCSTESYNDRVVPMSGAPILIRDVMPLARKGWIFLRLPDRKVAEQWEQEEIARLEKAHAEAAKEQIKIEKEIAKRSSVEDLQTMLRLASEGLLIVSKETVEAYKTRIAELAAPPPEPKEPQDEPKKSGGKE
jgi:hypothetical protein